MGGGGDGEAAVGSSIGNGVSRSFISKGCVICTAPTQLPKSFENGNVMLISFLRT